MKEIFTTVIFSLFVCSLALFSSCTKEQAMYIELVNTLNETRCNEMVEVDLNTITTRLNLSEGQGFVISDAEHKEIPYQITHDHKVIFQVSMEGKDSLSLTLHRGTPQKTTVVTCGRVYPQRFDDLAWENDLVGFRAYGPSLQQTGEKAFGYDLFAKRGTHKPVLEEMYAMETDKIAWSEIRALKEIDPEAAESLRRSVTYHVDKGHGMDCYAVGPTLGAGVAALVDDNKIVYPWCYKSCQILDNGPLRFTARLEFTPLLFKGKEVVETREISLDAGSHLNKTRVSYTDLQGSQPIVAGIVLHDTGGRTTCAPEKGFMAYEDPTTGPDQGRLFLGHVFPKEVNTMTPVYFSPEEVKVRNQAKGHLLAEDTIQPNGEFCYYWGFGWNRAGVTDYESWIHYLEDFTNRLHHPLHVHIR